jgi:peptide/nickel transport system permease protein
MLRYAIGRLLLVIPLFLIVSFGVFVLVDLAPGDAAVELAGQGATQEQIEEVRLRLGMDDPLVVRYIDWLGDAITGDFGTSLTRNQPVSELISSRIPPTLSLAVFSLVIAMVVASIVGVIAAFRQGGWLDRGIGVWSAVGIALPSFWIGLLLVVLFALERDLFPATGYVPLTESPGEWFHHLVLPALALSWVAAAELTRHIRSAVIEVLDRDYVLTARAKGMRPGEVVRRHVARNAGIPIVTVLGARVAALLGGTVVIETMFAIPGIGSLAVQAVQARDIPVILGIVAVTTLVVLIVNLFVDLSYAVIDPRAAHT